MILTGTAGQAVGVLGLNWKPQLLMAGLYLGGTLLAGAVVIALVKRWRKRTDPVSLTPSAQLAQFRSLYEEGAISQEEFERLRSLLGGQMRQDLNVLARRPAPAPQGQTAVTPEGSPPPGPGPRPGEPPETGLRPG
jgi:hypothetical protein